MRHSSAFGIAAEVMGSKVCDAGAPCSALHNVPHRFRRDVFAPDRPSSADSPKDEAGRCLRSVRPVIHRVLHLARHWNRSHVLSFADQVGYNPVLLPDLQVGDPEPNEFRAPEAAADQNRQNSPITLPVETIGTGSAQQRTALIRCQPVSNPYSEPLCPLRSANARRQLRAQQTGVRRLIRKSPDGGEPNVDCRWSQIFLLQEEPIPKYNGPIEREARFGAVPPDELIDGVAVGFLRTRRRK